MQRICHRGIAQAWANKRQLADNQTFTSLSSLGRQRLRSSSMTSEFINAHTHDQNAPLVTLSPEEYRDYKPFPGQRFMIGIHPWDTTEEDMFDSFQLISDAVNDPAVIAFGEIGLDPMQGAPIDRQLQLLRYQLNVATNARMPIIFHIVRRYDLFLQLHKEYAPVAAWGVHGFRAKPPVASQLAAAGIYMSVGHKFNPESVALIPDHLLLLETDQMPHSTINEVAEKVAEVRKQTRRTILNLAASNLNAFLVSGQRSINRSKA